MEKGLIENTGKSLSAWITIVRATKIEKHGEIIKYLKSEHGFTYGFANFVAIKTRGTDAASFDEKDLIANQYKGKDNLKPIYDRILAEVKKFGDDVEIATKKANVSLKTKKQFALVQPSTKTRIDLGIKLKGVEPVGRLENSGPFGAMCTHRIKLTDISEVDDEVINYLREAYHGSH